MAPNTFENLGHQPLRITLGEVETASPLTEATLTQLKEQLKKMGFEMIDDARSRLIENTTVQLVHHSQELPKINYSQHIEAHLHKDYANLSALISEVEGMTIEKYIIHQNK